MKPLTFGVSYLASPVFGGALDCRDAQAARRSVETLHGSVRYSL